MTATERTADEINRSIAELMGGARANPLWYWFRNTSDAFPDIVAPGQQPVFAGPAFTSDLNALRDGPEAILRAAPQWWKPVLEYWHSFDNEYEYEWRWIAMHWQADGFASTAKGKGHTEAMARALAAEAALKEMKQ